MKKLTTMDIHVKDFSKSMRGYDVNEVRNFLDEVSKQIQFMEFENAALKDKLREKEMMMMDYKEREGMLKDTMTTAQRVTESIKKDASKESLQIITQAKMRADAIMREARQNMKHILDDINMLKRRKIELTSSLRTMMETQLRMLDKYETEKDELIDLNIPYDTFAGTDGRI
jgi:cell division initiation protein